MSALAALILAVGACIAAGVLCLPLHRIAEVLAEMEIRSTVDPLAVQGSTDDLIGGA